MLPQETNPGAAFKEYFEIVPALNEELKNEAFRIRHQVYCEELKYEQERPKKLEIDEYDRHAFHLLIRSLRTKEYIGCTRIIRPNPENPDQLLPFEKTCMATLDRSIVDPRKLPRLQIAEVSRLAVVASYRRRKDEKNSAIGLSDNDFGTPMQPQLHPRFPYIPLGLYFGTAELARLKGINTLFVLTEERLANHLNKLGFGLQFIGKPIDHRGTRFPSMMSVRGIIEGMRSTLRPLYNTIATDINRRINPPPVATKIATTNPFLLDEIESKVLI